MSANPDVIDRGTFIAGLAELPDHCILDDDDELLPYECDGLSAYRVKPWLVLCWNLELAPMSVLPTNGQACGRSLGSNTSGAEETHGPR